MFRDQVPDTVEPPVALLEKVNIIEGQRVPSIQALKSLAHLCHRTNWEYGVQVYESNTGDQQYNEATYIRGERDWIREPGRPKGASRGIFFHSHNDRRRLSLVTLLHPGKIAWYMLPSDGGVTTVFSNKAGDIVAHWNRELGGYLNIVSNYGITLHIGMTRNETNEGLEDSQWEIVVGKHKRRVYKTPRELLMDHKSVPDPVMVWAERWPNSNTQFLLLLSWDKMHELTPAFTDVENLCFGDGVEKMLQSLDLDVPHKRNLSDVAQTWIIKTSTGIKEV